MARPISTPTHLSTPTDDPEAPAAWVRMLNGKRGLDLVGLYLVIGEWRVRVALSGLAGSGMSHSRATGVQVVSNGSHSVKS